MRCWAHLIISQCYSSDLPLWLGAYPQIPCFYSYLSLTDHQGSCNQAKSFEPKVFRHDVILKLESIQRRVTKIIKRVKDYCYKEKLKKLESTTLPERRMRSYLIELSK